MNQSIQIYKENPFYWQYRGKPTLLIGGSDLDNIFQMPDVEKHIDLMKSVGTNYIRCTMSGRREGNAKPYCQDQNKGVYDLTKWNPEYWDRFDNLLRLTSEREIIVQITIWATYDFYKDLDGLSWSANPFNPKNNINYTTEKSGLPEQIDYDAGNKIHPFFRSVPDLDDLKIARSFQEAFVDKILSYTFQYNHVLYNIDNETSSSPEWGWYWASHIKKRAADKNLSVEITEMWNKWDINDGSVSGVKISIIDTHELWNRPQHSYTLDHPEYYSFLDISQNNMQFGQTHYDALIYMRERIKKTGEIRPMNCIKMYGGSVDIFGNEREGEERFWRNIFGGVATCRFHRPQMGLGLSSTAQTHIKSMRMLTDRMHIFSCEPHSDLLSKHKPNEAYCIANPGNEYAVCFMDGGEASLDSSVIKDKIKIHWLDITASNWHSVQTLASSSEVQLKAPGKGFWAALIIPTHR